MPQLIGSLPSQVPTNGDLGGLAFRDYVGFKANLGAAPTLASAATIQPAAPVVFVSGTAAIATIVPPLDFVGGGELIIIPTGLWTTTTAGNIALASTAVVSRAMLMTYDRGSNKWYPSY
jgi:hypothetical protein